MTILLDRELADPFPDSAAIGTVSTCHGARLSINLEPDGDSTATVVVTVDQVHGPSLRFPLDGDEFASGATALLRLLGTHITLDAAGPEVR